MQPDKRLGVIGGGNMAQALLHGAIAAKAIPPADVLVAEPLATQRQKLAAMGVAVTDDNLSAAAAGCVLLAVKPQVMPAVLAQMAPVVGRDATIISIAAGIRTSAIDAALGGKGRIIRVMPNTPLMVGAGVSALAAGPRAGASEMAFCQSLFAASGRTVVVREEQMDAVTAVSGSGPAYFFYLIEAMVAAVVREGLDDATALSLAVGTCQGAGALLAATAQRPEALRAQVTSPNGTTQRAIETMDAAGVKDALIRAIRAAAQRSRELGR